MRRHIQIIAMLVLSIQIHSQTEMELDTIQVIASHRVESTAMQGFSRNTLERRGVTTLADAINRLSGVHLRDYGGAGGLKTLSVHSLGAGHTAVVFDGMVVSDSESGQIDLSRFTLEQIDSMALVIGDASNIFTPAMQLSRAAALHLVKRVPKKDTLSLKVVGGSFGLVQTCIDGALKFQRGWTMRIQGDFLHADNRYPFTLTNVNTVTHETRQNSAINRGRGEVNFYHKHDFSAKVYYYDVNKQLPGQVIYYNPVNHERDHYRNFLAQMSWHRGFGERILMQTNARGSFSREHYYDYNKAWVRPDSTRIYDQAEAYANIVVLYQVVSHLDVSLSTDYNWQQLKSGAVEVSRPCRHTVLEALRLRWCDKHLTTTISLLSSQYVNKVKHGLSANNCHRLSPSASLAYTPWSWLTARVYYKDIFRPATFNDNYYTRSGCRNLHPEKARNLGWGVDIQKECRTLSVHLGLEAYHAWVADKIVSMPMNAFFWNVVNVGRVNIWGTEVRMAAWLKPAHWLVIEPVVTYTFQQALNTTDPSSRYYRHQLAYTPRHSANGSLSILTPWLSAALNVGGVSERWSTNPNLLATHIDGYHVYNISLWHDWRLRCHTVGVRVDLQNVASHQYEVIRLYPMPGRSFKVTTTYNL